MCVLVLAPRKQQDDVAVQDRRRLGRTGAPEAALPQSRGRATRPGADRGPWHDASASPWPVLRRRCVAAVRAGLAPQQPPGRRRGSQTMHVQRTSVTTAFSHGDTALATAVHRAGQPG
jgi:hypothetical protein